MDLSSKQPAKQELFDETFVKKLEQLYILSKRAFKGRLRAQRKTKKAASGIEFADHRNYSPGDDLRALDWKVYGRTEKLLLRLFEEEEDLNFYFLLDCSASMAMGTHNKLHFAKQMLAALAYVALSNLDRVSITPFHSEEKQIIPPSKGKGQIFRIFKFLNALSPGQVTSLSDASASFVKQTKRRGVAVVLSDFYAPEGYERALDNLHYKQFETYVLHLINPQELTIKHRGDIELLDTETMQSRHVVLTPALIKQYEKAHEAHQRSLQNFCAKRNMLYVPVDIEVSLDDLVVQIFRSGAFLK